MTNSAALPHAPGWSTKTCRCSMQTCLRQQFMRVHVHTWHAFVVAQVCACFSTCGCRPHARLREMHGGEPCMSCRGLRRSNAAQNVKPMDTQLSHVSSAG
eukprot:365886-Chlamydomonas_euryale.AAC.2